MYYVFELLMEEVTADIDPNDQIAHACAAAPGDENGCSYELLLPLHAENLPLG